MRFAMVGYPGARESFRSPRLNAPLWGVSGGRGSPRPLNLI